MNTFTSSASYNFKQKGITPAGKVLVVAIMVLVAFQRQYEEFVGTEPPYLSTVSYQVLTKEGLLLLDLKQTPKLEMQGKS